MQASTPINVDKLRQELLLHPDREFVDKLLTGLVDGFDTGISSVPLTSFQCKNLRSAIRDPEFVSTALQSEVDDGYMIGPFDEPPFQSYRISPIGVAEGKYSGKKRLIIDLSAPHDHPSIPSINALISKEEHSLTYVRVDDAITVLKKLGRNACMCKIDVRAAFKNIPLAPAIWHLYGVCWDSKYYFCCRLAFGCRSSPKLFDLLSQAICWIAANNYGISHILHLLDDFWTADSPQDTPERTMALLTHIFNSLRVPTVPHKTLGPSPVLEFLGTVLDSVRMEARLPSVKVDRLRDILTRFATRSSCTKQELLSLVGHLSYASRVVVPGRSFLSYLIRLSTTVQGLYDRVYLNSGCRADIRMWSTFVNSWNGVSLFLDDGIVTNADLHLFTDASAQGFAGVYQDRWFQNSWPPQLNKISRTHLNMALLELFPVVVAAVLWGHEWSRKNILFHCDNMATVHIINKGRSKCSQSQIMQLMRRLTICAARHHFNVHSVHVPGSDNTLADFLSRFQNSKFHAAARYAKLEPCPVPPLSEIFLL
jgi:hypothetical protein